jgi:hypothetical protein
MESIAVVLLLIVLGGGGLLVALIYAIISGSARTARMAQLEEEQASLRKALHDAHGRIAELERGMGTAFQRLDWLRANQAALPSGEVQAAEARAAEAEASAREAEELSARAAAKVAARVAEEMARAAERARRVPVPVAEIPLAAPPAAAAEPATPAEQPLDSADLVPASVAEAPLSSADLVPASVAEPPLSGADLLPASVAEPPLSDADLLPASVAEPDPASDVRGAPPAAPPAAAGPAIPVWSTPSAAPAPAPVAAAARVVEPPPPSATPPSSAAAPPLRPDWERWIGVRGAAALGACILVLAGLYFFKYSIEHDLVPPVARVILGTLVGLGGIGASELMLRRKYTVLANWLGGAGIAILYTSFWASSALFHLVDTAPAFGLMGLVTVACGLLALRHDAIVIALLGLLGGFITPMALASGEDHPFGLFGYLLLLDGALLYLAVRRGWAVLGGLSLLGTAFYQVAWIGASMGPDRIALGMGIIVVFGALYGVSLPVPREDEPASWRLTRAAAVLLPYAFGLYFGLRADSGEHLAPLGVMLAMLSGGAAWMARARQTGWIALSAAVADVAVVGAWLVVHDRAPVAWEIAGVVGGLAALFHAFRELGWYRETRGGAPGVGADAAAVSALGGLFLLVVSGAAPTSADPWPWLAGWAFLGALAVRQSLLGSPGLRLGVALLIDLGVPVVHAVHAGDAGFPAEQVHLSGIVVVATLTVLGAHLLRREARATRAAPSTRAPARRANTDEIVVLLPLAFALYFAARADAGPRLLPLAALLAGVAAASAWAGRAAGRSAWMAVIAAIGGLGVLLVWLAGHDAPAAAWEVAMLLTAFAATLHVFTELPAPSARASAANTGRAASIAAVGAGVLLLATAASAEAHAPWPFVAGVLVLAGLVLRQSRAAGREALPLAVALVLGLGLPGVHAVHRDDALFPPAEVWLALCLAVAIAVQGVAQLAPEGPRRRWASHGAALLALLLLAVAFESPAAPALLLLATVALLALALVSAARLGHGGWVLAATLAGAFVHLAYVLGRVPYQVEASRPAALVALGGQALAVVLVAAWPLLAARRLSADAWAWRAAALAGPVWFPGLYYVWTSALGKDAIGLLPIGLGAVTAGVATLARPALPAEGAVRKTALVWLFAITLCAVSVAIPLQLDNEWITVGWALEGVALLALWKRMDHAGVKYTALAHLGVVAVRLVLNPSVVDYHARGSLPVLNWLLYTYWIPAACLLGAWWLLRELEVSRGRPWERGLYDKGHATLALACAAAAIVVFFVWENLAIFDAFGSGPELRVAFDRLPARDLTLSLSWAIYGLVLLGLGMARRSAALRWTSLMMIIITMGKVFLYDLSHLHDLYRVMSLVGLAFSLILISLAYQRFVFARRDEAAK